MRAYFKERECCSICNEPLEPEANEAVTYRGKARPFICVECENKHRTDNRIPLGYTEVAGKVQKVYYSRDHVVIMGDPTDDSHSCDAMGCGSLDHVLFRTNRERVDVQVELTEEQIIKEMYRRK